MTDTNKIIPISIPIGGGKSSPRKYEYNTETKKLYWLYDECIKYEVETAFSFPSIHKYFDKFYLGSILTFDLIKKYDDIAWVLAKIRDYDIECEILDDEHGDKVFLFPTKEDETMFVFYFSKYITYH